MDWSPQQIEAMKAVKAWIADKSGPQVFRLFGFAGTGKTTLATELAHTVRGSVLFGAFTGKAALMMQKKGCVGAKTIHSMIYVLDDEVQGKEKTWEPKFAINPNSAANFAKLIVIDECSMVGPELAADLLSFGCKVLVLGDPAQLPHIRGAGYFTDVRPDIMLTEVHRQARDNPIIRMSMIIREGGALDIGEYGESRVIGNGDIDAAQILAADQVLVGLNRTRRTYNQRIRALKGFADPADAPEKSGPKTGERLVCLRNNRDKKLMNGGLWTIKEIRKPHKLGVSLVVASDDHVERLPTKVVVRPEFFNGNEETLSTEDLRGTDQFTYGYALTTHKSQGSQWESVVVFDESAAFREDSKRWLYTAITRAEKRITVVQGR